MKLLNPESFYIRHG